MGWQDVGMPETHDSKARDLVLLGYDIAHIPSLYWHTLTYPKPRIGNRLPLTERAWTNEQEEPFRTGRARAVRLPLTRRAVVVGVWGESKGPVLEEEQTDRMLQALEGRLLGVSSTEIATWGWQFVLTTSWWQRLTARAREVWQWRPARRRGHPAPTPAEQALVEHEYHVDVLGDDVIDLMGTK